MKYSSLERPLFSVTRFTAGCGLALGVVCFEGRTQAQVPADAVTVSSGFTHDVLLRGTEAVTASHSRISFGALGQLSAVRRDALGSDASGSGVSEVQRRLASLGWEDAVAVSRHTAVAWQEIQSVTVVGRQLSDELVPSFFSELTTSFAAASSSAGSNPLRVVIGNHDLQPEAGNQLVTLQIQNVSSSPVEVGGLTLYLQVADGGPGYGSILGPQIESAELGTGAFFDGNNTGTQTSPSAPQLGAWSISTDSGPVSIAGNQTKVLGLFRFSTVGVPSGQYDLSLRWTVPGIEATTAFDDVNGNTLDNLDLTDGQLTVVPEPWAVSLASALSLGGFVWLRRAVRSRGNLPA